MKIGLPNSFDQELTRLNAWIEKEGGGLTVSEATKSLELSRIRVIQLISEGKLDSTKFFSTVVISRRSFAKFKRVHETKSRRRPGGNLGRRREESWWEKPFLARLSQSASPIEAAECAGVSRQTVYAKRKRDVRFAKAWLQALRVELIP